MVDHAANAYLRAASSGTQPVELRELLLRLDCEVLKLYSLPLDVEQSLLTMFTSWERVGVPFQMCEYMPTEVSRRIRFSDFLEFEQDWPATNRKRGRCITKPTPGTLTPNERVRLEALEAYADYHLDQVAPRPTQVLDELEKRLFSRSFNERRGGLMVGFEYRTLPHTRRHGRRGYDDYGSYREWLRES